MGHLICGTLQEKNDYKSSFPYENFLRVLKKLIRKPNYPLKQVIKRTSEIGPKLYSTKVVDEHSIIFKREHDEVPIPDQITRGLVCMQYRELYT